MIRDNVELVRKDIMARKDGVNSGGECTIWACIIAPPARRSMFHPREVLIMVRSFNQSPSLVVGGEGLSVILYRRNNPIQALLSANRFSMSS